MNHILLHQLPNQLWTNDIWKIFKKWGIVQKVSISHKLNQRGCKFRFVRFLKVKNGTTLEKELDNIWIRNFRLHFNMTRFNRLARKGSEEMDVT